MTQTLFDLTLELARTIAGEEIVEGIATGGTTTTLIDTAGLALLPDDYFNSGKKGLGSIWVHYDAGGAGASPENEYRTISDFVQSTKTITVPTAFSAAPASGDWYAALRGRYPLQYLIMHLNRAIRYYYPRQVVVDTASIVPANGTLEYSLPSTDVRVIKVEQVINTTTNEKKTISGWAIKKTAAGTADKLVFYDQPDVNYGIELTYDARMGQLRASTDNLDEGISTELVVLKAAYNIAVDELGTAIVKNRKETSDVRNLRQAELSRLEDIIAPTPMSRTPRVKTFVNKL